MLLLSIQQVSNGRDSGGSAEALRVLENYQKLFSILGQDRKRRFVVLVVLSVFSAGLQLVGVGSVFPLMALLANPRAVETNSFLAGVFHALELDSYETFLTLSGTFMVLAILASNALNVVTVWYTQKFITDEGVHLSDILLQKYAYKPYVFFLSNDSTSLCRDVLAEVGIFLGQFVQPLLDLVVRSVTILALGGGLVYVNPMAALGSVVIFGGGYLGVYFLCRRRLEELGQIRIDSEILKFKITYELFQGQREARLLNCRENFFDMYTKNSRSQQRANLHSALISQLPRQGIEVLGFALVFLLIMLFRSQGKDWADILPLLSLYAVGAVRMMPQFQSLFGSLAALRTSSPVVERLAPEFASQFKAVRRQVPPLKWSDAIEFTDLSYTYPGTEPRVLDGLNCRIEKGSHIGFVGSTGAGKTTLINIILGLLSPTEGGFLVDGEPITEENILSWQSDLGFVPQDIFLCNDTIAANIAFGLEKERIDMERVREAAELASLSEHVESLPEGYDTIAGERGVRLSGGQRQRLGIARALYRRPSILVLDEATSALDGRTEDDVMDAIRKVGGDKTLLLIAHRLTTLKECHTIFMLERGKIVDSGTYDELIEKNQTFRSFAKIE